MDNKLSRRDFVKGAVAAGAVTAAAGMLAGCSKDVSAAEQVWDKETEVLVVGHGFAGLASAITAADAGSKVLVIEKAPEKYMGGNSRVCLQAIWTPKDTKKAIQYFKDMTTPRHLLNITDAQIEAFIVEASKNPDWLAKTCNIPVKSGASVEFDIPSAEGTVTIHQDGMGFQRIWKGVFATAQTRKDISFLYETPAIDLITDSAGQVIGVKATNGGKEITIKAKKAVILCCGGFEFDETMKANNLRAPVYGYGTPYNTGDGHKMCQKLDIDFWHMNADTFAASLGALIPYAEKGFEKCVLCAPAISGGHYIWTDKYGKRFMNEGRPYQHGFGYSAMEYQDSAKLEYPRIPLWHIFDQAALTAGTALYWGGIGGWQDQIGGVTFSKDLAKEMSAGLVLKGDTIQDLAAKMKVDPAVLSATMQRYNSYAASGADAEFGRPAAKMAQMVGPYYAIQLSPVEPNTNGGPRRDEKARILRTDGTPVPRLYSAGEFGSIWSWYYQAGGNTSECLGMGRIAGSNAANETAL